MATLEKLAKAFESLKSFPRPPPPPQPPQLATQPQPSPPPPPAQRPQPAPQPQPPPTPTQPWARSRCTDGRLKCMFITSRKSQAFTI
ncbi:uncharacterized protein LOC141577167 isoform X1 [Camelus bactrianus]|uniref:Uncharacterized protein LOC141577167 isoform X1 n=1 Tax=Camelus bactrianus TaxID=9837 RepID=A0AC58Q545_CAMBA